MAASTRTGSSPPPGDDGSVDDGPQKYTVNLTSRTKASLERTAAAAETTRTDVINKAVRVYELLYKIQEDGSTIVIRHADGTHERLHLM